MEESILTSTKQILGLDKEYTHYDLDVITHINTTFSVLQQIGIGPDDGFMIVDDKAMWADFFVEKAQNMIKTYVYLKVRAIFDPHQNPAVITAWNAQAEELFWRLAEIRRTKDWLTYQLTHQDPVLGD